MFPQSVNFYTSGHVVELYRLPWKSNSQIVLETALISMQECIRKKDRQTKHYESYICILSETEWIFKCTACYIVLATPLVSWMVRERQSPLPLCHKESQARVNPRKNKRPSAPWPDPREANLFQGGAEFQSNRAFPFRGSSWAGQIKHKWMKLPSNEWGHWFI